jgi:ferredoxin
MSPFYRAFLDCVQEFGRLSELALMGSYNMSSGRLFTNMAKAPWFFLKGKITLSPHKIRQIERLERVFPRVEEGEELRGIRPPRGQGEDGHVPAGPRLEGLRPGRQADRAGRRHPERGPGRGNLLAVVAHINEGLCQGCGACAVTCRSKSIEVQGFRDDQLYDEINAICG